MPQVIRCPHCQKQMQVPDNAAGRNVRCPSCNNPFTVPAMQPVGAAASTAAPSRPPAPTAPAPKSTGGGKPPSVGSLNLSAPAPQPSASATVCPQCNAKLLEGAIACMDCGYLLQ